MNLLKVFASLWSWVSMLFLVNKHQPELWPVWMPERMNALPASHCVEHTVRYHTKRERKTHACCLSSAMFSHVWGLHIICTLRSQVHHFPPSPPQPFLLSFVLIFYLLIFLFFASLVKHIINTPHIGKIHGHGQSDRCSLNKIQLWSTFVRGFNVSPNVWHVWCTLYDNQVQ